MVDILDINLHYIGAKVVSMVDILDSDAPIIHCVALFKFYERIGS